VLSFVGASKINLGLHVPNRPDILVNVKQVVGAEVNNQQFRVEVDGDAVEILFDLKGQRDERVRVEVYHPDETEKVEPTTLSTFFNVAGSLRVEPLNPVQDSSSGDWQDSFDDPAICGVFLHLERHGSLTEMELTQMLGSPTSARRFARKFDEYVTRVPFSVRIEVNSSGKRYVKQV
jgi:hypothetical protein